MKFFFMLALIISAAALSNIAVAQTFVPVDPGGSGFSGGYEDGFKEGKYLAQLPDFFA